MKVWLLQRAEPTPHDNGGAQRLMRTGILARMLVRAGHQVLWWTSTFDHYNRCHRFPVDERRRVEPGYEIQYLRGCGYRKNVSLARLRENSAVARKFRDLSKHEIQAPQIIVASLPTAELALEAVNYGKARGIAVVLDIRDLWPDVFLDLVPAFMRATVRFMSTQLERRARRACSGADAILGLTDAFVDWGVERANRDRSEADRVFPMGYLVDELPSVGVDAGRSFWNQRQVSRNDDQMIVAFFGALGKMNNLLPVISAARVLERRGLPIKFIICGAGENDRKLQSFAKGLTNVDFPGWVNADQIRSLLELTSVGIVPYIDSPNFIDNIPNKPAEYLSGGAAIALSLNRGALHDVLTQQDCGFSYAGDPDKLADQLEFLLHNPERRRILQSNALNTFSRYFNGEVLYNRLVAYLEEIAESKAGVSAKTHRAAE